LIAGLFFTVIVEAQLPNTAAGRQFSAWLSAQDSQDRVTIQQFVESSMPLLSVDQVLANRNRTGGYDVKRVEDSADTRIVVLAQQRATEQFVRIILNVAAAEPNRITSIQIQAVRPPSDLVPRKLVDDSELVAEIGRKLQREAEADRFSGAFLLGRLDDASGKVLFSGAYGLADRESNIANKVDTRFRIGSMTKMFTAVAVLQLVQVGKINLDDPLRKYIPEYPNKDVAGKVTIHHLLTHTGGTGDVFGPELSAHRLEVHTHHDYIAILGTRGLRFEPGSRWEYSNYGMVLLGAVIERVSGQNFYEYIAEHVYGPAGMARSGSEPETVVVPDRAIGYMKPPGATAWSRNTDTLGFRGSAAGGSYSTVNDLFNFAEALMGHKLLNADYTDLLITGKVDAWHDLKYAYGFEDGRKNGVGAVGHNGGAPGMNGELRIYPRSGYVVVVLSNLDPPAAQQISTFVGLRLPQE
jgi:CubicO group peptidase (beta-lactamase class C family)